MAGNENADAISSDGACHGSCAIGVNVQGLHSADGLNIQQRAYSNDDDYKDEWDLFKINGTDAMLMIWSMQRDGVSYSAINILQLLSPLYLAIS